MAFDVPSDDDLTANRAAWAEWEAAGRPYPLPTTREYLTMDEAEQKYGTYAAADGSAVPVVPGHVAITDFVCVACGTPAPGFVEYGGVLVCSRLCGPIAAPTHDKWDADIIKAAAANVQMIERRKALEAELAALGDEIAAL